MTRWFRDLPLRRKLILTSLAAVGLPLLLGCAVFVAYDRANMRDRFVQGFTLRAQIVGRQCVPSLEFDDPESAGRILASLGSDHRTIAVALYDRQGRLFATYRRPGSEQTMPLPARAEEGTRFDGPRLVVSSLVSGDDSPLGWLVVESDVNELDTRQVRYGGILGVVVLLALALAYVVTVHLQRHVAATVLHMADVARSVAGKDFSARVRGDRRDELGLLMRAFNSMLDQIQEGTAALRDSQQRLQAILDSTTALVTVKDLEGRYLLVNRRFEAVFARSAADLFGRSDYDVFPSELADALRADDRRVVETRTALQVEETLPQGEESHVFVSVKVPLFGEDGRPYGTCVISTDITETRRLEEARWRAKELEEENRRAQEATKLKSEFLANMSHELRTPLNAIIGFSSLLFAGKVGPLEAQQKEFVGDVLTSSRHLLQLINDVLDLAKVESGKLEFRPEDVDFAHLAGEVCNILRTLAAEKRLVMDIDVDAGLGTLHLDPAKLKQLLYNYVSNAIKFTGEGGRVTIRARPEGAGRFRVEVQDAGIGIRPEDLGKLFSEFTQLDSGEAKRYQGTGLGLALCKRIVEAQDGFVGVQSILGEGSTFFAVLPRRMGAATERAAEAPHGARLGPPRVLVVEDEVRDRTWLVETLTQAGYAVEGVGRGHEAVDRLAASGYDALVLDILLPDMTGWDVLRAARREGPNRDILVVMVSVVASRLAAQFPIHDFLTKPLDSQQLLATLHRAGLRPGEEASLLVVDDDPAALRSMQSLLADFGYRSVAASDGAAALELAAREPPAAVVLDLLMPGMNGLEFLTRFRGTPEGRRVPVIVWTSADVTPEMRQRLEACAQGVVAKGEKGAATLLAELDRYLRPGRADERTPIDA